MEESLLCCDILYVIVLYDIRKKENVLSFITTYYPLFMLCILSLLYMIYRIQPMASTVKKSSLCYVC